MSNKVWIFIYGVNEIESRGAPEIGRPKTTSCLGRFLVDYRLSGPTHRRGKPTKETSWFTPHTPHGFLAFFIK